MGGVRVAAAAVTLVVAAVAAPADAAPRGGATHSAVTPRTAPLAAAGAALGRADAATGACPAGEGVTVVVDPGPLGGPVRVACAEEGTGNAAQLMLATGFRLTYVQGQPFVCRIDGRPGPDREGCGRIPPDDAYWGLFWSDGPSGWTYSTLGVAALEVPGGGALGWRFQDGRSREDPSVPPSGGTSQGASAAGAAGQRTASGPAPAGRQDDDLLPWVAGGAVGLLAAVTVALGLRRRRA